MTPEWCPGSGRTAVINYITRLAGCPICGHPWQSVTGKMTMQDHLPLPQ